jgi:hypothetical protein
MKQLLSLFLFLLPCLALAQYPSNGNQKITLGEQTTADGLIFRGVAATDTVRKPSIDTMAYMVLDTTTNIIWHYKKATSNAWLRLNLLPSDTASMLTPYWRSGRFSGTLPVANGGTGTSVRIFVDTINTQTVNGAKTFSSTITGARFDPTSSSASGKGMYAPTSTSIGFSTNNLNRMTLDANGNLGFGIPNANTDWNNGYTVFQTNYATYASENARIGQALLIFNAYNTGPADNPSWKRVYGNNAGYYEQSGGYHAWHTASSGAANSDISFIQGMKLGSNSGLSIGTLTAAPANGLLVNGDIYVGYTSSQGAYKLQVQDSIYVGGRVSAAGYTTRSDYNLKDEIKNINYGLNEIMQITPVSYTYKSNSEHQLGFIAQDIGVIIPESVHFDELMGVDYQSIIPILTKAIQEQQALIKALEQRIINLENK